MKNRSDRLIRLLAAATVVAAAALMMSPVSARTPGLDRSSDMPAPEGPAGWQPDPEDDVVAGFGIDPMVTGPVSDEFRERQARLGCLAAKWPDVPSACYPDFN